MEISLLMQILNDNVIDKSIHIYCYSHQIDSSHSMFSQLSLWQSKIDFEIYILDSLPGLSGYIGFNETKLQLIKEFNINYHKIHAIPFLYESENMVNTYNESKSVI